MAWMLKPPRYSVSVVALPNSVALVDAVVLVVATAAAPAKVPPEPAVALDVLVSVPVALI